MRLLSNLLVSLLVFGLVAGGGYIVTTGDTTQLQQAVDAAETLRQDLQQRQVPGYSIDPDTGLSTRTWEALNLDTPSYTPPAVVRATPMPNYLDYANEVRPTTAPAAPPGTQASELESQRRMLEEEAQASLTDEGLVEQAEKRITGYHIVQRGDNLSRIAAANDTTVQALMYLNDLKSTTIYAGQRINVGPVPEAEKGSYLDYVQQRYDYDAAAATHNRTTPQQPTVPTTSGAWANPVNELAEKYVPQATPAPGVTTDNITSGSDVLGQDVEWYNSVGDDAVCGVNMSCAGQ